MSDHLKQSLMLADDLFAGLDTGEKLVTIRTGKRDIEPGRKLTFIPVNGTVEAVTVYVKRVSYCLFEDLLASDIEGDGAGTLEELFQAMQRFYPNITCKDLVTVIEFIPDFW